MLRKKAESLDLWRVKDVSVKKSMTQRTRKCGDVEITSADASTPKVTLAWIQNPDEVAEQIRQAARDARKRPRRCDARTLLRSYLSRDVVHTALAVDGVAGHTPVVSIVSIGRDDES
jgi:hypothetical protein